MGVSKRKGPFSMNAFPFRITFTNKDIDYGYFQTAGDVDSWVYARRSLELQKSLPRSQGIYSDLTSRAESNRKVTLKE